MSGAAGRSRGFPGALPRVIAVTSGKGGVGKTSLVANTAICLARMGARVTVIDGDLGLANLDVLLGIVPRRTIEHFFREGASLAEIAVEGPEGIRVIPAGSGLPELTRLAPEAQLRFAEELLALRQDADVVLVDTAAGIADQVSRMLHVADRVLLVTWPEPAALVDAYAALKVMRGRLREIGLVVNGAASEEEARRIHRQLEAVSRRFLGGGIPLEGWIPRDEAVREAARRQRAVVLAEPFSPASRAFERLALHLAARAAARLRGAIGERWERKARATETMH